MTVIVDSHFSVPLDSRIDPEATRCLLGGRFDGSLQELHPDIFVAPELLATLTGRLAVLAAIVPSGHCVTGNAALWIFSGGGHPFPVHTLTTSHRSFEQVIAHRCSSTALAQSVRLHGLRVALPQRAWRDRLRFESHPQG